MATSAVAVKPSQSPILAARRNDAAKTRRYTTLAERTIRHAAKHADDPSALSDFPPIVEEALSKLTLKQRRFSLSRSIGLSQIMAYRMAYDVAEDREDQELLGEASNLASHPKISQAIELLGKWLDPKWLLDGGEVRDLLVSRFYEELQSAGKASDRLKAGELLGKLHGQFVSKSEIIHRDGADLDRQEEIAAQLLTLLQGEIKANQAAIGASEPVKYLQLPHPVVSLDDSLDSVNQVNLCPRCVALRVKSPDLYDGAGI